MPFFDRDGLQFHYRDEGEGLPFVFQHGLGNDVDQAFDLFRPPPGVRLIGLDVRGHGETRPLGDPKKVAMAVYADDLVALVDHLGLKAAVVGGISMGAALALNAALRYPRRVLGLVLVRPAWLDRPLPENVRIYAHVAQHILRHGASQGLAQFRRTAEFQELEQEAPAVARSVARLFEDPRAEECIVRLERIPHDAPCHDRSEWKAIRVPTLVLGGRCDPIHPWEFAQVLARGIPEAELVEVTPKSWSEERHNQDVQSAIEAFFESHFSLTPG
ncbi:MAG: alpha/beta hydrolase [Isosphaeraceae bacterium]|nr:alpha/beta hydrolase [Isosphaeraceae bacterium]